ncbi:MAG: glycosyltransferase, partial [Anaerolineae bacterium]|nr:glycosyltransferase [Anaerolineae bacterium]
MRLLYLTPQLPFPPQSGGPLRNFGLIQGVRAAGYTLDVLTFVEPGSADPCDTPLASARGDVIGVALPARRTRDRLRDLFLSRDADMARRYASPDYAAALETLLAERDYALVQIEGLEMACYLPIIRAKAPRARIVYDAHNAEYSLQRLIHQVDRRTPSRWPAAAYSLIQWRRLARLERHVCRAAHCVIAVSDADARALSALVPGLSPCVVPNGIDANAYASVAERLDLGPAALLFTGTMNYRPNVDAVLWFVDHVLNTVREAVPDARLFIVGNKPHERLDAIRQRPDVEVTGYVQDVTPFLHSAAVYVAPLRMGSGTRLKLLQAMAAGAAIVSTHTGAEGLDMASGREALLADEPTDFAQAVVALLSDPQRR